MIIDNTYSQKCNKNAKKNMLIYFEFWKHFFVYILKKGYQNSKYIKSFSLAIFLTFATINLAGEPKQQIESLPTQQSFLRKMQNRIDRKPERKMYFFMVFEF